MNAAHALRFRLLLGLLAATSSAGSVLAAQTAFVPPPAGAIGDDQVLVLNEFRVTGKPDDSYLATQSTSGTRMVAEIINLPYSVSVLTEDFIKDFQLFDLDEQVPFISGMAAGDPNAGGGGGTRLRGFSVPYFRNGFHRTQAPDSNSIARVEVVKGPQSAIYGRVSPGGVVNYISKTPSRRFQSGLSYTVGSYDHERVSGDITGPLVQDKLFYRVDATYYDLERPTDFWFNRTTNLSGALTWKLSDKTSVTLEHEYTHRVMQGGQVFMRWARLEGTTRINEGLVYYMPDRELGRRLAQYNINGARQRIIRENNSSYLQVEHRVSADLSIRANFGYTERAYDRHGTSTPATWLVDVTAAQQAILTTLNGVWVDTRRGIWAGSRAGANQTIDYVENGMQIDVTKKWNTTVRQRSLITFDVFGQETEQATWALSGTPLNNALTALGFTTAAQRNAWLYPDPFNPAVSGFYPIPAFDPTTWSLTTGSSFSNERFYYGGLVNHTVDLLEGRLSLVGSIRKDWAEYDNSGLEDDAEKFTYSVGANYHVVPHKLVAYANVATGFNPSPQTDPNTGTILGNRESFGGEIGMKGLLLNKVLSYSAAVFQVEEKNQVTDNPENPTGVILELPRYVPGATTRGKGINLDLSGKVTENLTLLGNIAWTHVRIIKHASSAALVGTRPLGGQNGPPRTYAMAARYSFRRGPLDRLKAGLTYTYAQQYLRIAPAFSSTGVMTTVPLHTEEREEWGAMLSYSLPAVRGVRTSFSLNVVNLLDAEDATVAAYYPAGREIRFTTNVRF